MLDELTDPSAFAINAAPVPLALFVKIPGAKDARLTVTGLLEDEPEVTVTVADVWPATSQGTWKLIWEGET